MSDSRTRIWFALFVLAVFVAGLASGVLIGRRMGPPLLRPDGPRIGMGPGPGMGRGGQGGPPPGRLIERLQRDLALTPEQRAQVEKIFEARRPRLEEVQREVRARAEQEQRELQAEIRAVLTPEQQARFDRWLEQPRGRGGRGRPPAPF
jgi:Spy/CpxP family protein refolding chaperone